MQRQFSELALCHGNKGEVMGPYSKKNRFPQSSGFLGGLKDFRSRRTRIGGLDLCAERIDEALRLECAELPAFTTAADQAIMRAVEGDTERMAAALAAGSNHRHRGGLVGLPL